MVTKASNTDKILGDIEKLTVLELSELVSSMEEKFGVSAAAPVAGAAEIGATTAGAAAAKALPVVGGVLGAKALVSGEQGPVSGAVAGASVGAAVGSVVPVIGTAVGAVIGGIGGFLKGVFD